MSGITWLARKTQVTAVCCFMLAAVYLPAATPRILVVGDSWAAGMTHVLGGNVFYRTLESNGYPGVGVVATDKTVMPGATAASWAANLQGRLGNVKEALEFNPTIDIVFFVTGGADFLSEANRTNLSSMTIEERSRLWKEITKCIDTATSAMLAMRPGLRVVLCDYDYLNIEKTRTSLLGWTYQGISQRDFNRCFVELGREKRVLAERNKRILYIQNWGVLQHGFSSSRGGDKPPLPGGPPFYQPYPGGDPERPSPPEAFAQIGVNDGIHPNTNGYRLLIENALRQGLGALLKAAPEPQ